LLERRHDLGALDREHVVEPSDAAQQDGEHPGNREHRVHEVAGTQKGDAAGDYDGAGSRRRKLDAILPVITHAKRFLAVSGQ
jgi:hypothetical protein